MKPNRVLTAATVLLLLAPALLVAPPADAQTLVPDAPPTKYPVYFKDVETQPVLFLRDLTDATNPQTVSRPGLSTAEPPSSRDTPPPSQNTPKNATDLRPRTKTKVVVPAGTQEPPSNPTEESAYRAQFTFDHPQALNVHGLRHDVTLRGANAVQVVLFVQAPPGLKYTAELLTNPRTVPGTQQIAVGTLVDEVAQGAGRTNLDRFAITIPLTLSDQRTEFNIPKGARLHLEVFASQPSLSGANQALDGGTWSVVYDAKEYPSRVILAAKNALKVASWTQTRDERPGIEPAVEVVFRDFSGQGNYDTLRRNNRYLHQVDGRYAVSSAFGLTDLVGMRPVAEIVDPSLDKAIKIHPWNPYVASCADDAPLDLIPMVQQAAAETSGTRVFRFQRTTDAGSPGCLYHDYWLYNRTVSGQKAAGEFSLRVKSRYQPSPLAGTDLVSAWGFQVSNVNVKLRGFSDGVVTETTSHQVVRGGTTTFLLNLTNGGAANDTIKMTVRPTDAIGGGFTIDPVVPVFGDVQVVGANLFRLGPGNSTVLAITLRAPNADSTASFEVTAQSQTDPSSTTSSQTLLLSAATFVDGPLTRPILNQALHQPRVLAKAVEDVAPGAPRLYSVFIWNRYVMPQTIDVQMKRDKSVGWTADLIQGGRAVKTATLTGVPAGGVVGLNLEVSVQRGTNDKDERVFVNATLPSGGFDVHEKTIRFQAKILETYEVRILEGVVDLVHTVETFDPTAFARDFVNGAWYRVWITNNDAQERTFKITTSLREDPLPVQAEAGTVVWGPIKVYHRDAGGAISTERDTVKVKPGQTAERFVWVKHDPNNERRQATTAKGADLTITVQRDPDAPNPEPARSKTVRLNIGAARFGSEARAMGVKIDPVGRLANYSIEEPYIDISRIDSQKTEGVVPIGGLAHYRFRVTNGASWWYFKDPVQTSNQPSGTEKPGTNLWWDHRLNVTLTGVDTLGGWTAYYRLAAAGEGELGARKPAPLPASCESGDLRNKALWTRADRPDRDYIVYPPLNLDNDGTFAGNGEEPVVLVNPQLGREGFWDGELEVVVCPPSANFTTRPLAGQFDELQIHVGQVGPRALQSRAIWEVKTVIEAAPKVVLEPRVKDGKVTATVHPSRQEAVIPVFVANNGSYLTNVSLQAKFKGLSNGWTITGASLINITPLRAFENRTLAFRVLPPQVGQATVEDATVEIVATYPRNLYDPLSPVTTVTREVKLTTTQIVQKLTLGFGTPTGSCSGSATTLTCTAQIPEDRNAPMQAITVPLTLRNELPEEMIVTVSVPTMDGWRFAETNNFRYQKAITVPGGQTVPHSFLVYPPREAVAGSYADMVVSARDQTGDHLSTKIARIAIQGGLSVVTLDVARGKEFVERNATTRFPIAIRNDGNVDGHFRLAAFLVNVERAQGTVDPRLCSLPQPQCWQAWIEDLNGARLDNNAAKAATIYLTRNELRYVNLTVKAPLFEQENAFANARLIAWNTTQYAENRESGRIDVKAEIQDYGVELTPATDTMTLVPGRAGTMLVGIKNKGDANDTLNLSLDLGGLTNWRYQFSTTNVFLPSGSGTGVLLTIQTPIDPLPAPRTAKFWIFLGTRGGQATNVSIFDFEPLFVTIPDYRQLDVDGDNITELAVDADRDRTNGYEEFVEYSTIVRVTKMLDKALGKDRKTKYLLDVPTASGTYDNVADRFWDPDSNLVTAVKGRLDLDKDQTTDYLLDTDGDDVVDTAYQAATRQFLKAERVKLLGAEAGFQYLLDSNGDGKPDRYFDPVKNVVTKLVAQRDQGPTVYGVDTDDDGRVDLFYDDRTKVVTPAGGVKIAEFLQEFWYVPVGFVAILVLFGVVLMRRRAGGA